ncbi:hypothetical protein DOTSEDRAFT_79472 [Dothistroma septosporum NZE10]|uniref:Uncharacterized protein n=1 Tax=Dothistroma septosporum (strain NZE10 / CBS 128990) TaxID=675120 RepID=N1PSW3_DOTSN|nr:hypothetical protein DOTSEDRAFT_79472 [Dothistroma septosporum NZE10]
MLRAMDTELTSEALPAIMWSSNAAAHQAHSSTYLTASEPPLDYGMATTSSYTTRSAHRASCWQLHSPWPGFPAAFRRKRPQRCKRSMWPLSPASDTAAPIIACRPIKGTVTFESLPGELRNHIYDLSGCLRYWEPLQLPLPRTTLPGHALKDKNAFGCVANVSAAEFWPAYLVVNGKETPMTACGNLIPFSQCSIKADTKQPYRHRNPTSTEESRSHGACFQKAALTNVSAIKLQWPSQLSRELARRIRNDALSIYYGDHPFVAKLYDDEKKLLQWLDAIGPVNAARKRSMKYIKDELLEELCCRGLNIDEKAGVLTLVRMPFPFRYDEKSVLSELDKTQSGDGKAPI